MIEHDGRYWMYYCAGGDAPEAYRIHLATSDDCWPWERHPANPMVVDGYEARDPMVLRVGDRWVMYYTANLEPDGGRHIVAAASPTTSCTGRAATSSTRTRCPAPAPVPPSRRSWSPATTGSSSSSARTTAGSCGSCRRRGAGPDPAAYRRTRVLASPDPLRFRAEDQVATIASHAAEVIHDEQDRWWVSHCGWGEGGAHLAPLTWR